MPQLRGVAWGQCAHLSGNPLGMGTYIATLLVKGPKLNSSKSQRMITFELIR